MLLVWFTVPEYSNTSIIVGLDLLLSLRNSHLAGLNNMFHFYVHCSSKSRSACNLWQSSAVLMVVYSNASTKYSLILHLILAGKSLIKHKKSTEPNTEPCSTPEVTSDGLLWYPSTTTCCFLSESSKWYNYPIVNY